LYATIDVGVLSSRNEGTPVAILESMAAAKPVVATRVGGVVDLVRDGYNGFLVPAAEPQRLAAAMRALAEDAATRRAMGSAGRQIARTYTREALVERMAALYEAVLNRKRLSRRQRLA
jgi:glycosyltransferase involved in cell wall biosynthesis